MANQQKKETIEQTNYYNNNSKRQREFESDWIKLLESSDEEEQDIVGVDDPTSSLVDDFSSTLRCSDDYLNDQIVYDDLICVSNSPEKESEIFTKEEEMSTQISRKEVITSPKEAEELSEPDSGLGVLSSSSSGRYDIDMINSPSMNSNFPTLEDSANITNQEQFQHYAYEHYNHSTNNKFNNRHQSSRMVPQYRYGSKFFSTKRNYDDFKYRSPTKAKSNYNYLQNNRRHNNQNFDYNTSSENKRNVDTKTSLVFRKPNSTNNNLSRSSSRSSLNSITEPPFKKNKAPFDIINNINQYETDLKVLIYYLYLYIMNYMIIFFPNKGN